MNNENNYTLYIIHYTLYIIHYTFSILNKSLHHFAIFSFNLHEVNSAI